MIQYSLLGRTAASIRLNTTFRGLAPSPSSGKTDLTYNSSVPCFSTFLNQFCLRMGTELDPKRCIQTNWRGCAPEKTILNHVAAKVLKLNTLMLSTILSECTLQTRKPLIKRDIETFLKLWYCEVDLTDNTSREADVYHLISSPPGLPEPS
jgi:hypothetical protein